MTVNRIERLDLRNYGQWGLCVLHYEYSDSSLPLERWIQWVLYSLKAKNQNGRIESTKGRLMLERTFQSKVAQTTFKVVSSPPEETFKHIQTNIRQKCRGEKPNAKKALYLG